MRRSKKRLGLWVSLVAVSLMGFAGWALALGDLDPTTTWNVTPVEKNFPSERACPAGTTGLYDAFQSVTEKTEGTYTESILIDGVMVTVEITTYENNSFDFNIINGVTRQMFVKGDNYLLYQYDPKVSGATNTGPVSYDTGLHDGEPENPQGTAYKDVSHLDFCLTPVYPLTAEKTASGSYDETWTWTLTKSVDPESQSEFAGNALDDWTWTVDVGETFVEDSFSVTGSITVYNENTFAVPFTISDVLSDGTVATVTCPDTNDNTGMVPAAAGGVDGSVTCSYTAAPDDALATLNTATVTSGNPAVSGAVATAPVSFTKTVVNGTATVDDDQESDFPVNLVAGDDGTRQWTETQGDSCSDDPSVYVNGSYSETLYNTATLTSATQDLTADADTTYTCYAPVVTKDATGSYDETWTWTLTKSVDPESQSEFAGNELDDWTWTVTVSESSVDENFAVTGTIYVNNPAGSPGAMTVSLVDQLNDGTFATVDCGEGATSVTVASGQQGTCSYTAAPTGMTATLNTATGTFNGISGFVGTAPVSFTKTVVNGTATVDDDQESDFPVNLVAGDDGTRQWTETQGDSCSDDPSVYVNGSYSETLYNTATLTSATQDLTADADTTYTCYAPVVTKDATGSYDETWTWTLTKSVVEETNSGYPGDFLDWTWTVTVSESTVDENFAVTGTIYVNNPAGSPGAMTVSLVDQLNDGTFATVDCGEGATSVTVASGQQGTCSYTAAPTGMTATLNTATGTFNGISGFAGTAPVSFTKNVVNGTATVDDDQEPDFPVNLVAGDDGTRQWTETQDHTCSTDWADYVNGSYSETLYNTATLTSDDQNLTADADTTYTCEAFTVVLLKTTNGIEDPDAVWSFELYEGPDGFGTEAVASDSTPPALLDFGGPALRPDTTYTVCEVGVPAGWTSFWQLNGSTVIPYNPDANSDPAEDLGNRCYDFGGTPDGLVPAGTVFSFAVDNSFPGGDPRTPGYWKNWNRCTNGGQAANADRNGGWEEGYWLLEDVLAIGGGIVWDDILDDDTFEYVISECEQAVAILDHRTTDDGKKVASDPLHNLARNLLAAQLNFGAGACTTQGALNAAIDAEKLLDKYDFDGTYDSKRLPRRSSDAGLANRLASYLDDYNNGEFCGSTYGS